MLTLHLDKVGGGGGGESGGGKDIGVAYIPALSGLEVFCKLLPGNCITVHASDL